ncbi:MAG: site-specific DNA-methyltransferase [candidate division WOR-3 bacterium]|nr:site-specific DNA-methyltransferase [candidate division WOR-3 bacterium]
MSAKRPRLKKVERETPSIVPEQVEKLKELFPEAVSEGKVDFDRLRQTLGEFADDRPERYSFTWAGKRDCIKLLQVPSRATLVPSPDESIDWDTTNNVFIEGENLEVLKLLYKAYYGRVKMVYIDPPYNTGKDFIYPDNYADPLDTYLRLTGQKDSEGNVLTSNPETSGRYHSSWLSMMYPRLFVARQLLRDDGVIFVSIDDNEVYNLRAAMNEVFGEENFLACFVVQSNPRGSQSVEHAAVVHEYVLFYARQTQQLQSTGLTLNDAMRAEYKYTLPDGRHYRFLGLRQRGGAWRREQRPLLYYPIFVDPATGRVSLDRSAKHSIEVWPVKPTTGEKGTWRWNKRKVAWVTSGRPRPRPFGRKPS